VLLALALAGGPRVALAGPPPIHLDLGPAIAAEPLPLTVAEADLFRRWGGSAEKLSFRAGSLPGSLIAVFSRSFRAHHPPEICLAGSGVRVEGLRAVSLGGADTVRVAAADGGRRTAIYWFQSPARTTGDLASRIWDDVRGHERRWVQISIVVDAPLSVDSPEGRALVSAIRAATARFLAEEIP
jgi:exosortase O